MFRLNQIISAIACLLLLAWAAYVSRMLLEHASATAWGPVAVGGGSLIACGFFCFFPRRLSVEQTRWLFAAPALCLLSTAVLPMLHLSDFTAIADQLIVTKATQSANVSIVETLVNLLYSMANAQLIALWWSCTGSLAAVIAAGLAYCPFENRPPLRSARGVLLVAEIVVLFPVALYLFNGALFILEQGDIARGFRMMTDRVTEFLPSLICAIVLQLLVIKLLPIIKRIGRKDEYLSTQSLHRLTGTLIAGLVGVAVSLLVLITTAVSTSWIDSDVYGFYFFARMPLHILVTSPKLHNYHTILIGGCLAISLVLLWHMRRHVRHWAPPLVVATVLLVAAVYGNRVLGIVWADRPNVDEYSRCGTSELITAIIERRRPKLWAFSNPSWGMNIENADLIVPEIKSSYDIVDATTVSISRTQLSVNDHPVAKIVDEQIIDFDINASHPLFTPGLFDELSRMSRHLEMIKARTGGRFEGQLLLIADRDTPMKIIYQVLHTARRAKFMKIKLLGKAIPKEEEFCREYVLLETEYCDEPPRCP